MPETGAVEDLVRRLRPEQQIASWEADKLAAFGTGTESAGTGDGDLLRQLVEECLRVLQVHRIEAFGEPGVERGEEGAGGVTLVNASVLMTRS